MENATITHGGGRAVGECCASPAGAPKHDGGMQQKERGLPGNLPPLHQVHWGVLQVPL